MANSYDPPAWEAIIPPERRKTAAESLADWERMVTVEVWCMGCERKILIARDGESVCSCGTVHTWATGRARAVHDE